MEWIKSSWQLSETSHNQSTSQSSQFSHYILHSFPEAVTAPSCPEVSAEHLICSRSLAALRVCSRADWRWVSVSEESALVGRWSLGGAGRASEAEGQSAAGAAVVVSILVRWNEREETRWETPKHQTWYTVKVWWNSTYSWEWVSLLVCQED